MSLAGEPLARSVEMGPVKSAVRRLLAACLLAASVVLVGGATRRRRDPLGPPRPTAA